MGRDSKAAVLRQGRKRFQILQSKIKLGATSAKAELFKLGTTGSFCMCEVAGPPDKGWLGFTADPDLVCCPNCNWSCGSTDIGKCSVHQNKLVVVVCHDQSGD